MTTARRKSHIIYRIIKRFLDILFSLVGMVFLVPITLVVGTIIKLQDGGPIFFKQTRTGKNGKDFELIKFRSMPVSNDVRNFDEEDQMTKFGSLIRGTSIDELPQIWNILKGEMSFIGPRPWIPEYYRNMSKTQRRRCVVRPGLTGLAQVKGRNKISVTKRIQYDLEYIDNFSFGEDIRIVFLTLGAGLKKETAYGSKQMIREEITELKNTTRGDA